MATTKAVSLVDRAALLIQDTGFVRWTKVELLGWLNDACKEVVVHRPDASTVYAPFPCEAGTRQSLPSAALRLIDIPRNTSGGPVTQVDRAVLDEQLPTWHTLPAVPASAVEHFCYDSRDPATFWVYPRVEASTSIDIVYSSVPADITSAETDLSDIPDETLNVSDAYANAVLDYMLYRAYSKDTAYAGNMSRAQMHLQGFATTLGIKIRTDAAISPRPVNPDTSQARP